MSNKSQQKARATKPEATASKDPKAPAAVVAAPTIVLVKKDAKLRGARDAWYQLLGKHDGKPVTEFYQAAKDTPPALTKAGTAEDPRGWVRYFVRTGVVELKGA